MYRSKLAARSAAAALQALYFANGGRITVGRVAFAAPSQARWF